MEETKDEAGTEELSLNGPRVLVLEEVWVGREELDEKAEARLSRQTGRRQLPRDRLESLEPTLQNVADSK